MPPGRGPRNAQKGDCLMRNLIGGLVHFVQAEDGPTAVEYAVMLALIIVVCLIAITALGTNTNKTFSMVSASIASVSGS